jgi:hypothetical protein
VDQIDLTAEQLATVAEWGAVGDGFCPVSLRTDRPAFVANWRGGDLIATQGDAYIQVAEDGRIRDEVPPAQPAARLR